MTPQLKTDYLRREETLNGDSLWVKVLLLVFFIATLASVGYMGGWAFMREAEEMAGITEELMREVTSD